MWRTGDTEARGLDRLRSGPLGKVLILVAVLVVAALVARSCGETETEVTQEQAIAIAREQIDFTPTLTQVRVVNRGFPPSPSWFVSLSIEQPDGTLSNTTVVVVDGGTGEVLEIRRS